MAMEAQSRPDLQPSDTATACEPLAWPSQSVLIFLSIRELSVIPSFLEYWLFLLILF